MIRAMKLTMVVAAAAPSLAACGSGSPTPWANLRSVRVSVAQPGVPPPAGLPRVTSFTTASQLTRVTAELNAHHIREARSSSGNPGCAGGHTIAITIVPQRGATTRLDAYRCANQTTGNVEGDLVGFLAAFGYSV